MSPQEFDQQLKVALGHHQRGDIATAELVYQRLLAAAPRNPDVHHLLGVVAMARGQLVFAIRNISRAISIAPKRPVYYNNLGTCYLDRFEKVTAELCFRKALSFDPEYLDAWNNLGLALIGIQQYDEARDALLQVLKRDPKRARTLCNMGMVYFEAGRYADAIEWYDKSLAADPRFVTAHLGKTACLTRLTRIEEALALVSTVPAIAPDRLAEAMQKKGSLLVTLGRMEEACLAYDAGIAANPDLVELIYSRATLRKVSRDEPFFAQVDSYRARLDLVPSSGRARICYALGKSYQDVGDLEKATTYYALGAASKREEQDFDEDQVARNYAAIQRLVNANYLQSVQGQGDATRQPIFIVGMPRSGTTLVEQILGSHPDVYHGGELRAISECIANLVLPGENPPDLGFGEAFSADSTLLERAKLYLQRLAELDGYNGQPRITDKMPGNHLYVGLMAAMFPNAKIIHCRRDPIDTCVSCYALLFSEGQEWSYDFHALGRHYRRYWNLMEHWDKVLPGKMYPVRYEQMVEDTEGEARKLLEWCGLDWNPQVLKFHETKRSVNTASVAQVRQPIYTSSMGRWKKWEPYIQPLISEISDLETAYWEQQKEQQKEQ